jgi:hypothetical protein
VSCAGRRATIVGTTGDDVIVGTDGRDIIVGRGGSDVIDGGAGADVICGGHGADLITGGPGRDVLLGCSGWLTTSYGEFSVHPCDEGDVMVDATDPTLTDAGGAMCPGGPPATVPALAAQRLRRRLRITDRIVSRATIATTWPSMAIRVTSIAGSQETLPSTTL